MTDKTDSILNKPNICNEHLARRYRFIREAIHLFVTEQGIVRNVDLDDKLLKTAITAYYDDIIRIKNYHNIERVNFAKIYGYSAYWLLKRKPLHITTPYAGSEFINEQFITSFLISNMLSEKGIKEIKNASLPKFLEFQNLLFYNIKYRPVSQQSLELMVEAFFTGCDF